MKRPKASSADAEARMKRQRRADTKPELVVRTIVHQLGRRFSLRTADLPGSPDLANRRRRWAIFVHGCFWHQHPGCRHATMPKANREFWTSKFAANQERDARVEAELRALGYNVIVVWECETRQRDALAQRLAELIPPSPMRGEDDSQP